MKNLAYLSIVVFSLWVGSLLQRIYIDSRIDRAIAREVTMTTCGHCGKKMIHILWHEHFQKEHMK